jgi:nicotinamidase-related amidase
MVDAQPYSWPYDGVVEPDRLAVVVAGDQVAWVDRSFGAAAVATAIGRVTDAARVVGAAVVHVRHAAVAARPSGLPPERATRGWGPPAAPPGTDVVVEAGGIDGFHASDLDDVLRSRGIDHLVFVGYGAEAAVDSTLRSANDRGYECLTLMDAVAPFDPETGRHALSTITMSGGIFGAIATTDALLDAFLLLSAPVALEVP